MPFRPLTTTQSTLTVQTGSGFRSLSPTSSQTLAPEQQGVGFFESIRNAYGSRKKKVDEAKLRDQSKTEDVLQATGQAAGLLGDVGFEALRKVTPQPIKDVGSRIIGNVAKNEDIQKAFSAYQKFAQANPREAADLEAVINIASLLPAGKSAQIGKEIVGEGLEATGKALVKSGEKGLVVANRKFAEELITPIQNISNKTKQVGRTTEKGVGPFKKNVVELTPQQIKQAEEVANVPGVSDKNTLQKNYNAIKDYNVTLAQDLEEAVKANDFSIPRKEVKSRLKVAADNLANSPVIVGDAEKTAQKLILAANKFIDENPGTGSGLLKARKDYDAWVKSQKPKAFDAASENAFTVANREIRQAMNDLLDEKAVDLGVKESLQKQSALYSAMDVIAPKAAREADSAIGRAIQRASKVLGTRNKAIQALIAVGGVGAAATLAPTALAVGGTGYLTYKAGKFLLSPQVRKNIGIILKEGGSKLNPNDRKILEKAYQGTENYLKNPKLGASIEDVTKLPYKGETDLTTKILKDLEGKTTVSKQYILDATNRGELKQVERDLIRQVVDTMPEGQINVSDFAKKVKAELLPLKIKKNYNANYPKSVSDSGVPIMSRTKFESISLPAEIRGKVKNYDEHLYESPIKTSAGSTHFPNEGIDNYFGHTRIEDMADNKTRRVIEVQSDLYQKGRLESEEGFKAIELGKQLTREDKEILTKVAREAKTMREFFDNVPGDSFTGLRKLPQVSDEALYNFAKEGFPEKASIQKLQQYNDPTAHFRMIREEIKKAAQDGKTKLQFPTGETAMKIEGLGGSPERWRLITSDIADVKMLEPSDLKVGATVADNGASPWIITDVLGDGKFKAVQKKYQDLAGKNWKYDIDNSLVAEGGNPAWRAYNEKTGDSDFIQFIPTKKQEALDFIKSKHSSNYSLTELGERYGETFDISGKVDTNNPIYKFYEKDMQKYLTKFGGKRVVDDKGVEWIEVPVKKEWAKMPVEAFSALPFLVAADTNRKQPSKQ